TIKKRVQEILDKMGATNRAQAVAQAIREGLI
ncbi:MAG: DNA-binding response regulator, partial [Caldilineae bacterium]